MAELAMAELAIVVVTYECRDLVLDCLDSLDDERSDVDLDVVVIDNLSQDGTLDAIAARHPWVRGRSAGGNLGFSKANNLALADVVASAVLLLNPDTVVPPGTLRACLDELAARPEVGMLGCKLVQPDGKLDHAAKRGFPTPVAAASYFLKLHRLFPGSPRFAAYTAGHIGADAVSEVDAINGAFMLVRAEALRAVGPLDERFWMYGEDLDWCRRFWDADWPVLYWPRAEIVHVKGGSSNKVRAWKSNRAFHEAMWLFHRKHYADKVSRGATAAIGTAIGAKLVLSASRSYVARSVRSRRSRPVELPA